MKPRLLLITVIGAGAACTSGSSPPACDATLVPGDLVITEIFADHAAPAGSSGADAGHEWFEIYDASSRPIDLQGLVLTLSRPDGSSAKSYAMTGASLTVAPGAYVVLGDVDPAQLPAWADYGYGTHLGEMSNTGGGRLALSCAGTEIDAAAYADAKAGFSQQLDGAIAPDASANDDPTRWCTADSARSTEYDPMNFGTPRAANQACAVVTQGMCNDGGTPRAIAAPTAGQIKITEWMPDPAKVADAAGEWIEVQAQAAIDLNGLQLGSTTLASTPVITGADCVTLASGAYALFARNIDPAANGGLPAADGKLTFALANANGKAQVGVGGAALDTVTWTTAKSGTSIQIDGAGVQCNAPASTPPYDGTDVGTPKAAAASACP